ncbi:hypothetical protein Tco_1542952, partial [Tanacetum coccineum]
NGAAFIGRKTQRSMRAVPAVPDISGGRQAYKRAAQKFFKENEKKILSEAGDGFRIYPDGVIFDEKKLGSS